MIKELETWLQNELLKYPNNMLEIDSPEYWREQGELSTLKRVLQWLNKPVTPKTTKRDIAYAIAREFFPDASDDDLVTLLWTHTDYPDWLGDAPEKELKKQLKEHKKRMEAKGNG